MSAQVSDFVTPGADGRGPRERMIMHAADLIGRDGVAATSIGDVIAASGAPRGSIYHHFPGAKTQLVTEAVCYAGDKIAARMASLQSNTPAAAVADIGGMWRRLLLSTDYQFGCPVLAGGMARRTEQQVAEAAATILGNWTDVVSSRLILEGVDADRAESLATLIVCAIEGAVAICQTRRSVEPLDKVVAELSTLCAAAITS